MSERKYYLKRDGNHFKISAQNQEESQNEFPTEQRKGNHSIWSKIASFIKLLFWGIVTIITFLIATPFFILRVLWHWVIAFIALSIFWSLAYIVYNTFSNSDVAPTPEMVLNDTALTVILIVSLIVAIMTAIRE